MKRKTHFGFTLVEVMVVVAIIGILAAIGVPRVQQYLLKAETDEAVQQMGRTYKNIQGFYSSRINVPPAEKLQTLQNFRFLNTNNNGNQLSELISEVVLESPKFSYEFFFGLVGDEIEVCGVATVADGRRVAYTSTVAPTARWENHVYRSNYIDVTLNNGVIPEGGCCNTDATAFDEDCDADPD